MADSLSTGPRTIAAIQLAHLRSLLGSLRPANSFYEKKLGAADIDKDIAIDHLGLTGCLTLLDIEVVDINISSNSGNCEDSIKCKMEFENKI